jgi:hypothetical protein
MHLNALLDNGFGTNVGIYIRSAVNVPLLLSRETKSNRFLSSYSSVLLPYREWPAYASW